MKKVNLNLKACSVSSEYEMILMSDGEKVILYLITQVLQAPKDGFIVIDEPEMSLHKTILKRLNETLESERPDCLYLFT